VKKIVDSLPQLAGMLLTIIDQIGMVRLFRLDYGMVV